MQILRKLLTINMVVAMIILGSTVIGEKVMIVSSGFPERKQIKIVQISKELTDDYIQDIDQGLKDIQKENDDKVELIFYDSKSNQLLEDENIDKALKEGADIIFLDLVDTRTAQEAINKIKQYNIPVILFNREPLTMDPIKSYSQALYIGTESKQAGALQGKMLVDAWNSNREYIDNNKDNIMQYIILQGERYNKVPIERTKYSVLTIQEAGIKTEELALRICEWDKAIARDSTDALLLKYGDKIEVIISNDDTMALGAIEALQKYGYNKGENTKTIPIVGVDAIPEVRELIAKGIMLGSVDQNPRDYADALYTCAINLVEHKSAIEGTKYTFDDSGVAVRLPYQEYIIK